MTHDRLFSFKETLSNRKGTVIATLGWTLTVTSIIFLSWKIFYDAPKYQVLKWLHSPGEAPSLEGCFLLLLLIISFVFGILLTDIRSLILGFLASQLVSLMLASVCGFCFNWFIRGACNDPLYASVPFAWEYIFFLAFVDVFRMMFPLVSVYCFIGAIFGNLLISWFR